MNTFKAGDIVTIRSMGLDYYGCVREVQGDEVCAVWSHESAATAKRYEADGLGGVWMPARDCKLYSEAPTATASPTTRTCTCSTVDLFRQGCRCGAITPYRSEWTK